MEGAEAVADLAVAAAAAGVRADAAPVLVATMHAAKHGGLTVRQSSLTLMGILHSRIGRQYTPQAIAR